MAIKPILFSGPMVRALIEGRKSMTRRVINPQPKLHPYHEPVRVEKRGERGWIWMVHTDRPSYQFATGDWKAPYAPGDLLYVREAWRTLADYDDLSPKQIPATVDVQYVADNPLSPWLSRFRQGMHMPRWASRITLEVTEVRVQRLQEISEADAIAEGIEPDERGTAYRCYANPPQFQTHWACPRESFRTLWDSLNASRGYGWNSNPWVVAYSFRPSLINVDQPARDLGLLPSTPEAK